MINRQATALSLTAISLLFSSVAFADSTDTTQVTADMHVNLTVEKSCQVSVGDMDFGSHTSDAGLITATTSATITCTNGTGYNVSSESSHGYAMKNSTTADTVAYTLSSDHSGTSNLSSTAIPGTGTGEAQIIPIYGKVTADALALAPAGDYSDTVTLTVSY